MRSPTSVRAAPNVTGAAPFIEIEALAVRKPEMLPVRLRGIDPSHEGEVARIAQVHRRRQALRSHAGFGSRHRRARNCADARARSSGDTITVLVPTTDANGVPEPRLREFAVAGVFDAAVQDYDSELLIAALDDVRALLPNPDARMSLHVNFRDALTAREYSAALAKHVAGRASRSATGPWITPATSAPSASRRPWWRVILMLIVAVAAFYLVAMLAMVVTDKRTDIAILRTLGTSPRRVMAIFLIQGSVIAWFGVALGVLLGSLLGLLRRRGGGVPRTSCSASRSSAPRCTP